MKQMSCILITFKGPKETSMSIVICATCTVSLYVNLTPFFIFISLLHLHCNSLFSYCHFYLFY